MVMRDISFDSFSMGGKDGRSAESQMTPVNEKNPDFKNGVVIIEYGFTRVLK
jgi:hypothetical protein